VETSLNPQNIIGLPIRDSSLRSE